MHLIVLGAGVVGVTTAWHLRQAGHEVTVLERRGGPAEETSYANGGQVSVSYARPWANPAAPAKIFGWLMQEEAPLLFRLRADLDQWRWGMRFLLECLPARTRRNMAQIVRLGLYSQQRLRALRAETGIHYDQRTQGILHFYTDSREFESAIQPVPLMQALGCDRRIVDADEAVRIEPALDGMRERLAGATYTPEDESGDARLFTKALAARCETEGVRFRYNTRIEAIERGGAGLSGVRVIDNGRHELVSADAYVLCLGSYSPLLTRPLGMRLPVFPVKGYSVTAPVREEADAYTVSLTDDAYKLVYSRLGERLRIAGTAEFAGYDPGLNLRRCRSIVRRASECFPRGAHWDEAEFWAGLRPSTPSNVPLIGRTRYPELFVNTGHGTLGWTHACGAAAAVTDIIGGADPGVDFVFTGCRL